jgi:lipopolysaccharide/colanic/teichoic acid biosynthesis glycosyltransferase
MTHLRNMPANRIARVAAGSRLPLWLELSIRSTGGHVPKPPAYARVKGVVEWIASLALLVFAVPLVAVLAVIIKATSRGPVFYSQLRLGRSGRPFRIYKLRTMFYDCEAVTGPVWSATDDPRVTRVGRWLRDTHLDELPQLLNVIRGEMALIGPRPERPEMAAKIERTLPDFADRLLVRPGITGLAQMRMPADMDLQAVGEKLGHDLEYIRDFGPSLDARICLSTLFYFVRAVATIAITHIVRPGVGRTFVGFTPADLGASDRARSRGNFIAFQPNDDATEAALANAA